VLLRIDGRGEAKAMAPDGRIRTGLGALEVAWSRPGAGTMTERRRNPDKFTH